jgi:hypothetical protein
MPDNHTDEARRAQDAFDKHVRPILRPEDLGKFVAIDIDSGSFEVDSSDFEATGRLMKRLPAAKIWLLRVGFPTTYRMGRFE